MLPPLGYPDQKATGDFYIIPIILKDRRLDLLIAVNSEFKAGDTPVKTGAVDHDSIDASSAVEGKRVLIVDDSRMSRRMLRTILENAGYSVIGEAENGRIGVEEYKKLRPDVTTLDITMPEMDGLEALEAILGFDKEANCVMITAAGQQDKLIRALKAGAKRFISKPFNEEEIVRNIQELA
ncbi:MAG: response regulator [Lachnospiraceae bacterium]|nr:response regulator [Lachnospiraceae bacterium]